MVFQTQYNRDKFKTGRKEPVNNGPHKTQPGLHMTIDELIRRFASGQPLSYTATLPIYDDGLVDMEKFKRMDFAERDMYLQELNNEFEQTKTRIEAAQAEQKRIDDEKAKHSASASAKQFAKEFQKLVDAKADDAIQSDVKS